MIIFVGKRFWVHGIELFMTVAAVNKNSANNFCEEKGMMLFEPRTSGFSKLVYQAAKDFGLKR